MIPLPKIFIASPLFNPEQITIIQQIENMLQAHGYDFYSARLHSGSDKLSPEERKDLKAWDPVFESNVQGLDDCQAMIAVLEYALPKREYPASLAMGLLDSPELEPFGKGTKFTPIELPDAGTVWEMGYHAAQMKPVLGFHTDKAKHLNLMLSHGCTGMLRGWPALSTFLAGSGSEGWIPEKAKRNPITYGRCLSFNWEAVSLFDAANKEVE